MLKKLISKWGQIFEQVDVGAFDKVLFLDTQLGHQIGGDGLAFDRALTGLENDFEFHEGA
jgi:hypothetical protein